MICLRQAYCIIQCQLVFIAVDVSIFPSDHVINAVRHCKCLEEQNNTAYYSNDAYNSSKLVSIKISKVPFAAERQELEDFNILNELEAGSLRSLLSQCVCRRLVCNFSSCDE